MEVPSSLSQAPAHLQHLVNEVLTGFLFAFGYLDDILIFSMNVEGHLNHLRIMFNRPRTADSKMK